MLMAFFHASGYLKVSSAAKGGKHVVMPENPKGVSGISPEQYNTPCPAPTRLRGNGGRRASARTFAPLTNSSANPLNTGQEMIVSPRDHPDEAGLVLKRHGAAIGPEREDCGLDRGSCSLGLGVLRPAVTISGSLSKEPIEVHLFELHPVLYHQHFL
jgi:hypothetical protein